MGGTVAARGRGLPDVGQVLLEGEGAVAGGREEIETKKHPPRERAERIDIGRASTAPPRSCSGGM